MFYLKKLQKYKLIICHFSEAITPSFFKSIHHFIVFSLYHFRFCFKEIEF